MNKNFLSLCAIVLACNGIKAQKQQSDSIQLQKLDEVVIIDSRFALKRENSGKTVIKISKEEIERSQGKTVAEIINTKSGIEISGSRGREGNILGVYTRGGRGKQVLIIIDGMRVSDPSSSSSEYDLRLLSLANIESIEIIKGAASTLYGTNAATAVINIATKKGTVKAISGNFQSTIGTQQTSDNQNYTISEFTNSALVNGTLNDFNYSLGFSNRYANGLSDYKTIENEKDAYSNYSLDMKLDYKISKKINVQLYANQTKLSTAYDDAYGRVDAPYFYNSEQERVGISSNYNYNDHGSLHLNAAYSNYNSENMSAFPNSFEGNNYTIDFFNKYTFNKQFYTILGFNYIEDNSKFSENKKITIADPYANIVYVSPFGLNVNTGMRLNTNSEYGTQLVYSLNPSYTYKLDHGYIKLLSSYATSYITPSLTQLYGFFGANADLKPEENSTIEGGLEYANSKVRLNALYFNRDENNPIIYAANGYENSEGFIDAQGIEVELDWNLNEAIRWTANYTFTERKGDNAIRIPKHKINASFDVNLTSATYASFNYAFVGKRLDTDFTTFSDVSLNSFSLFNLSFSHHLIPQKMNIFFNIDNLFNENFVETIGYTTRGRNVRIGFNLNL